MDSVSVTQVMDGGVPPFTMASGEDFMDIQQLLDIPHPNQSPELTESDTLNNGLGTSPDYELENPLNCQTEFADPNEVLALQDAPTSPLDGTLLYETPLIRQESAIFAEQVLGQHDLNNMSNTTLLQDLGRSVDHEENGLAMGPQLGEASPLEDPKDNEDLHQYQRLRYHSMNAEDYVFMPTHEVSRQRSMSENHASDILYSFASSPDDETSTTSRNNIPSATAQESTSQATTSNTTLVTSSTNGGTTTSLGDSFMNSDTIDTEALIDDFLLESTNQTNGFVDVTLIPVNTGSTTQIVSSMTTIDPSTLTIEVTGNSPGPSTPKTAKNHTWNVDERRNKNNEACRQSRKRRREKKVKNEKLATNLAVENEELRAKILKLEMETKSIRAQVMRRMLAN